MASLFIDFFYHLRDHDIKASPTEWLTLMQALAKGIGTEDLQQFYRTSRACLVKKESDFDKFDIAFASHFEGLSTHFSLDAELLSWLDNAPLPPLDENMRIIPKDPEEIALMRKSIEEIRQMLEERLKQQKERHDGGSFWVGTEGTSPFGNGGVHPGGIRIGGRGGNRSAVQVASERRFQNLRTDRGVDDRQFTQALRQLRALAREGSDDELDLEESIKKTAQNAGEIDLVFAPPRRNRVKVLLLMDVGGSMDPHALRVEKLFKAAHASTHFQKFQHYFFHNCIYDRLYENISLWQGPRTDEVLAQLDERWKVLLVGDAWMDPYELTHVGSVHYNSAAMQQKQATGIEWLRRLRNKCPDSVWLNPEPERVWHSTSIRMVRSVFPMLPLSLDGLSDAVRILKKQKAGDIVTLDAPVRYSQF